VRSEGLADRFQSKYDRVEIDDDPVDSHSISPCGYEASADHHEGVAGHAGHGVEVRLHTAKVVHEPNYVTMVRLYPRPIAAREWENIVEMIESIELVE
jgi:hypothetical protein